MSNLSYKIVGMSLLVTSDDGQTTTVEFHWPIVKVLAVGTMLIVRILPQSGANENENVFGVNKNGKIVWTVPKRKYIYEDSPFTGMIEEGCSVKLLNWDGTELLIDP
jgi:hypothetical protein